MGYNATTFSESKEQLSVKEKIFSEQQNSSFKREKKGPCLELFFHELTGKESLPKRIEDKISAIFGLLLLIILFPFIATGIKLFCRNKVINKIESIGIAGHSFVRYEFQTCSRKENQKCWFGTLLKASGLYKLPGIWNILNSDMSLVGPRVYDKRQNEYWNSLFSDFYKRHATKPGLIGISFTQYEAMSPESRQEELLRKELRYLTYPTLKKDLRVIFRSF